MEGDVAQKHQNNHLLVFEIVVIRGHATASQIREDSGSGLEISHFKKIRTQSLFFTIGKFLKSGDTLLIFVVLMIGTAEAKPS